MNAFIKALKHPVFTTSTLIAYLMMYNDIKYIKNALKTKFSEEDFKKYAMGASAGLKEVALYLLVRKYKPKLIVETGVANGISTYFVLKALHLNGSGKLISIDYPNYNKGGYITSEGKVDNTYIPKDLPPGWIVPKIYKDRWDLRLGKSSDILPKIKKSLDMFIHDSEHSYSNMMFELKWALAHIKNGVIICDDADQNNAFKDFIKENEDVLRIIRAPIAGVEVCK